MDILAGLSKTNQGYIYTYDTHIIDDRFTITSVRGSTNENPERIRGCTIFCTKIYLQGMVRHAHWLVIEVKINFKDLTYLMEHISGDEAFHKLV